MSDSEKSSAAQDEAPVPAPCQAIKLDFDKCVREAGGDGCKELMEAFQACLKTASETS